MSKETFMNAVAGRPEAEEVILEALEVIQFYADKNNWDHDGECSDAHIINSSDMEEKAKNYKGPNWDFDLDVGGLKAREFLRKYGLAND